MTTLADELERLAEKLDDEPDAARRIYRTAALSLWVENNLPAILSALRDEEWQGIETAPKDGTHFLAYECTGDVYRAAYHRDGYVQAFGGQPVVTSPEPEFWRPLPPPPKGTTHE